MHLTTTADDGDYYQLLPTREVLVGGQPLGSKLQLQLDPALARELEARQEVAALRGRRSQLLQEQRVLEWRQLLQPLTCNAFAVANGARVLDGRRLSADDQRQLRLLKHAALEKAWDRERQQRLESVTHHAMPRACSPSCLPCRPQEGFAAAAVRPPSQQQQQRRSTGGNMFEGTSPNCCFPPPKPAAATAAPAAHAACAAAEQDPDAWPPPPPKSKPAPVKRLRRHAASHAQQHQNQQQQASRPHRQRVSASSGSGGGGTASSSSGSGSCRGTNARRKHICAAAPPHSVNDRDISSAANEADYEDGLIQQQHHHHHHQDHQQEMFIWRRGRTYAPQHAQPAATTSCSMCQRSRPASPERTMGALRTRASPVRRALVEALSDARR